MGSRRCSQPRSSCSTSRCPLWAAALIVTGVLFAVSGVAALIGKKQVSEATPPAPEKAIAGAKQDVATIKGGSNA